MEKIRKRGDLKKKTIKYFDVKDPKLARFYLLPKIHKGLNNIPVRPVISLAQAVKSYIKDTNDFLNKLRSLPKLPGNIILCTVDAVGLYPNIPHEEGLSAIRKRLDNRMEKYISSDTLCDLALP